MAHGAFKERLRLGIAVFIEQVTLQGARVDPNADGNLLFFGSQQYFTFPFFFANVTGVNAYFSHAGFNGFKSVLVVEMNVGYYRDGAALHDVA
jgi:hypothetical protein